MKCPNKRSRVLNAILSIALVLCLGATGIYAGNSHLLNLSGTSESTDPYLDLFSQYPYGYPYDDLYPIPEPDPGEKYDRFIVKYKENQEESFKSKLSSLPFTLESALTIDSVRDSLEQTAVLPDSMASNNSSRDSSGSNELRSSESTRYTNIEVLILSEKIDPSEFEEMLISSGAYDDIVYVQPDYALEIANLDPPPTSTALLGSDDNNPNSSSASSTDGDGLSDDDSGLLNSSSESDDLEDDELSSITETGPPTDDGSGITGSHSPPSPNPNHLSSSNPDPIIIAIIDTGIDPNHPAYSSCLHPLSPDTYDPNNPLAYAHGTHIAGIIAETASLYGADIQILVLPVFVSGTALTSDILAAIETAEALGASIVNCSFGNTSFNQALYDAMEASPMLFICAAGNGREDLSLKPIYPASFNLNNVISVGSVNADYGYSYFSNYSFVDIAAVGREVTSAIPGGDYGPMTGTSMSAAKVSGAAAVVLSFNNSLTNTALADRILNSADQLTHLTNKVTDGRVLNADNALGDTLGSILTVSCEDDFDVHGYSPTPEDNWALFSSLTVVQIAAGSNHTLALMSDGSVWAWGDNYYRQLGSSWAISHGFMEQVIGLSNITSISAGNYHSLALKADGTVWAWGHNYWGQLGHGATSVSNTPKQVSGLTGIAAIGAGGYHSLAVKSGGSVWAWGVNFSGQLGDGTYNHRNSPVQVSGLTGITKAEAGESHSIALRSDGSVWAWGENIGGQLGNGTLNSSNLPVQVSTLAGVISIAAGGYHNLAIESDDTIWAWGYNCSGQIGSGGMSNQYTPVQLNGLTNVVAIATGFSHSLALQSDGAAWAWGKNDYGQLGDGTTTNRNTPVGITSIYDIAAITAGYGHSLAIKSDGSVFAWGDNRYGQLGDGITSRRTTPAQVSNLSDVVSVAAGEFHSLALKSDGTVWAWGGYNWCGVLGNGTNTDSAIPVQVSNLTDVVAIAIGVSHCLAIKSDGTVWAWGYGFCGQLGDGTTMIRFTPVQVSNLTDAVAIAAGELHSLALKSDGSVWVWGEYWDENGDGTDSAIPVQVSGLADVISIAAGMYHSLAVKSDGSVWIWDYDGILQVSNLTDVVSVAAGGSHNLALKSDGTVWAWGWNGSGQLGDGTTTTRTAPVQVGNLSGVTSISAGNYHSMALKADNTIWAWGDNQYGQLGDGTTTTRYTPVQVSGLCEITEVAGGSNHNLAVKTNGTVWTWGSGVKALGLARIQTSVPIPLFSQFLFDQSAYSLAIPALNSPSAMIAVGAAVTGTLGSPVPNTVATYALDGTYTGITINGTTGVVTVDSTALPGIVGLTASYNGHTISAMLLLTSGTPPLSHNTELILTVTEGKVYSVGVIAYDIEDFAGLIFVLEYDPLILEIDDLSALTWLKELADGVIPGTGITVISVAPGEIVFSFDRDIPQDIAWSGVMNVFRFLALDDGVTTLYIYEDSGSRVGFS